MKRLIILLLQALLVAAIVGGTYIYTENLVKPTAVLVFGRNLPRHTKISEGMLRTVTVPDSALQKVMTGDKGEVLGKYTGSEVGEGEPVNPMRLLNENQVAPEALLQGDMRKQSFEVDLARSNGGALKPGDYVDLLYYFEDNTANTARCEIFVRKIPVLDVRNSEAVPLNSTVNNQGKDGEETFNTGTGKRIPAVITVAVTPEQARQIVYYRYRGKIDVAVYPENLSVPEQSVAAPDRINTSVSGRTDEKISGIPVKPPGNTGNTSGNKAVKNIEMTVRVDNGRNR